MNVSREIKDENNPAKIGLIVSAIVIVGSLIPNFSSSWLSMNNENSLVIFFIGLFMFMLFTGIKINMNFRFEKIGDITYGIDVLPNNYTSLSKSFFWLAGFFLTLSIILLVLGF